MSEHDTDYVEEQLQKEAEASDIAPVIESPNGITPADIAAVVDRWHSQTFSGTRIANDTGLWNMVHVGKEDLKKRLVAALVKTG